MKARQPAQQTRRDVVSTSSASLSEAMLAAYRRPGVLVAPDARKGSSESLDALHPTRRSYFIEPRSSDPTGFERTIGQSDLTSINYLERGRRAARAICRIRVPADGGEWYGTGFLVGPRLLMTNQHVLGSKSEATQAEAEFGYEHDLDGVLQTPVQFNLSPSEIFYSDADLDVTFVAIAPLSDSGAPIDRFGWLPLLPMSGKSVDREWVTIIQHPGGGPKQISIRSSQILILKPEEVPGVNLDHFLHYLTDTEPGSSGAPVVNDQWQVVALHHKAVPAPADPSTPDAPPVWIGNEGVRVSAIYKMLERHRLINPDAGRVLDRLESALGFTPMTPLRPTEDAFAFEKDGNPFAGERWSKTEALGYKADFLSKPVKLAPIYKQARAAGSLAPLLDGSGHELTYHRFSVVVHAERKFALLTAVNIDGKNLKNPGKRPNVWRRDARMDDDFQPAGNFYEVAQGDDKVQFSRGHMVRLLDPCWGRDLDEAKLGRDDTFHYVNAAPQVQKYNDTDWGNLEDYVLDRAQMSEKKMSVFQGPIFKEDDPFYGRGRVGGPWRIPLSYWKIAVLQKTADQIAAAAFIVGQTQYVSALFETKVFSGLRPYRLEDLRSRMIQTTVKAIEQETGLDFSALKPFDAHGSLESTRQTRWINRPEDILL